jgi:hypothetical protein
MHDESAAGRELARRDVSEKGVTLALARRAGASVSEQQAAAKMLNDQIYAASPAPPRRRSLHSLSSLPPRITQPDPVHTRSVTRRHRVPPCCRVAARATEWTADNKRADATKVPSALVGRRLRRAFLVFPAPPDHSTRPCSHSLRDTPSQSPAVHETSSGTRTWSPGTAGSRWRWQGEPVRVSASNKLPQRC